MTVHHLPDRLSVDDAGRILKPNGDEIFLHGVNFGSWGEDDATDCPQIKAYEANALRINMRWWGKWGTGVRDNPDSRDNDRYGFLKKENRSRYIQQVYAGGHARLWTVPFIDSNCGQSGTNTPEDVAYCDPYGEWGDIGGHNFYTDSSMRAMFATIVWPNIATILRMLPRVGMLEVHPEPAHHRDHTWTPRVAQVQKECVDAIRDAEAKLGDWEGTPILVGAREGYDIRLVEEAYLALSEVYGGLLPKNLVWTGNLLNQWVTDPPRFDKGLRHLTDLRSTYGAAVFVQQLGRNSSEDRDLAFLKRAIAALREANVGYTWWQWKQNTSNPDNMGLHYKDPSDPSGTTWIAKEDEIGALVEDWSKQ